MKPRLVASSAYASAASGTSITPTLPLQATTSDVLIAVVGIASNATIGTPSGWIKIGQTNSGASWTVAWYVRTFATGNPAFTWTGSVKNCAQIFVVRGADFNNANNGTATAGTTSTVTSASVTTTLPETVSYEIYCATAATGLTAPTGWTQEVTNTGNSTAITVCSEYVATAGATGATSSTGAAAAWVTIQIFLPAAIPTPNNLIFDNSGWNKVNTTLGWDEEDDFATSRIAIGTTPAYRNNRKVATIVVQPGDNLGFSGERAEVAFADIGTFKDNVDTGTGTRFYGWSIMIPAGWTTPLSDPNGGGVWAIPLQLHTPGTYAGPSPPIAFNCPDHFFLSLNTGDFDSLGFFHVTPYEFSDGGQFNLGQWEDFVMAVNFQQTTTGSVQIWRRTVPKANFKQVLNINGVATLGFQTSVDGGLAYPHYWRQGLYRSASAGFTSTIYQTGLVYGKTFSAVEQAAFGTNVGTATGGSLILRRRR